MLIMLPSQLYYGESTLFGSVQYYHFPSKGAENFDTSELWRVSKNKWS